MCSHRLGRGLWEFPMSVRHDAVAVFKSVAVKIAFPAQQKPPCPSHVRTSRVPNLEALIQELQLVQRTAYHTICQWQHSDVGGLHAQ